MDIWSAEDQNEIQKDETQTFKIDSLFRYAYALINCNRREVRLNL